MVVFVQKADFSIFGRYMTLNAQAIKWKKPLKSRFK
jgi:hypothetical protein